MKYTIAGVTTEDTQEVLIGGILTLVAPRDNGGSMLPVSTIISYTLTPTFKSTNTQITVEYNLTNPSNDESVSTLSATLEDNSTDTIANILKDIKFNDLDLSYSNVGYSALFYQEFRLCLFIVFH